MLKKHFLTSATSFFNSFVQLAIGSRATPNTGSRLFFLKINTIRKLNTAHSKTRLSLAISIAKGTWLSHKLSKAKAFDNLQLSHPRFKNLIPPTKNISILVDGKIGISRIKAV